MTEQIQKSQVIYEGRTSRFLGNFWCMSNMLATSVRFKSKDNQRPFIALPSDSW